METKKTDSRSHPGIDKAVAKAGGIVAFCRDMDVTHQAVYDWKRRGWAPPLRAKRMQELYDVPASETMDPRLVSLLDDGGRGLL